MEHYFRTGLWIFVLIGCLQAAPVSEDPMKNLMKVPMIDLRFELLQKVTCNENVTFKSPNNVSGSCLTAVEIILEGLKKALNSCQCNHCGFVLESLDHFQVFSAASNPSACTSEVEGSITFQDFLKEFKTIVQQNNSA